MIPSDIFWKPVQWAQKALEHCHQFIRTVNTGRFVRLLKLEKGCWLYAYNSAIRPASSAWRYWAELRGDMLVLYPISQVQDQMVEYDAPSGGNHQRPARGTRITEEAVQRLGRSSLFKLLDQVPSESIRSYSIEKVENDLGKERTISLRLPLKRVPLQLIFDEEGTAREWLEALMKIESSKRKWISHLSSMEPVRQDAIWDLYKVGLTENEEAITVKVAEVPSTVKSDASYRKAMDERVTFEKIGSHPFVLSMKQAFHTKGQLLLLTEFCNGRSIRDVIDAPSKISEDVARFIAAEVLLAIEHLHKQKIACRDLDPKKILVDNEGHVRLDVADVARRLERNPDRYSHVTSLDGTRNSCAAPELRNREAYGSAADNWAFGVLLFEMLTGRYPDIHELYLPQEEIAFPENMTPQLCDLIHSLLRSDPETRIGVGSFGLDEIKFHEWFKGTDWKRFENKNRMDSPLSESESPKSPDKKKSENSEDTCFAYSNISNNSMKTPSVETKSGRFIGATNGESSSESEYIFFDALSERSVPGVNKKVLQCQVLPRYQSSAVSESEETCESDTTECSSSSSICDEDCALMRLSKKEFRMEVKQFRNIGHNVLAGRKRRNSVLLSRITRSKRLTFQSGSYYFHKQYSFGNN